MGLRVVRHTVAVETELAGEVPHISDRVHGMKLDALDDLVTVPETFALSSIHRYLDVANPLVE